ncbi:hypothetical protein HYW83_01025 [Candidatus Peregrinibacteria bacterium]|nr:hypothetical protein [Candidatus Peregrinibacteria bacterium]
MNRTISQTEEELENALIEGIADVLAAMARSLYAQEKKSHMNNENENI